MIGEGRVEERIIDFFDWGMDLTEEMRISCGKFMGASPQFDRPKLEMIYEF